MGAYLGRRLVYLVVQMVLVASVVFLLIRLVPGDPARAILGETATDEQVATMRHRLGIDQPIPVQYATWLAGAVGGSLGNSIVNGDSVTQQVGQRIGNTLELVVIAISVAVLVGLPLGVLAAVRANRGPDLILSSLAMLGLSLPNFVVGSICLLVFALLLRWLPQRQFVPLNVDPGQHFELLVLPVVTLAASTGAVIMRMMRGAMLEVIRLDYLRTARAKGLNNGAVLVHHALRNAINPVVSVVGLELAGLLGGTVIVETIYGWPGLSSLLLAGVRSRDYPTIQGVVLVIAVLTILVNLVVDLLYGWLDPRIRYS